MKVHFIILETLRLHPAGLFLTRNCTENCTLISPYNEKEAISIEKGLPIILPLYGLHMDPKYFSKPDVFDPERFAPENRSKIIRGSYLPFGDGPRICIGKYKGTFLKLILQHVYFLGQRFGLIQMKLGLINILKEFKVVPNQKTKTPLEIDPLYFITSAKGGLWVDFVERFN